MSMCSTPSRARLASQACSTQAREYPDLFGPSPILLPSFVARTQSSRCGRINSPTIASLLPSEYTSAVSMKFTPCSRACATMLRASSIGVWSANIIVPRHRRETRRGLLPRGWWCMVGDGWRDQAL